MNLFDVYPLQNLSITRAQGSFVWDDRGLRYLDLYGGHAVISIGHGHPHYIDRLQEQLGKIGFYSNSVKMPIQEELASLLGQVSGREDYQLFLCNSGAEANENALKLASFHTGRKKIVAFTGAFHGRTSLAVAATANPSIIAPVNKTENIIQLPFNDVDAVEEYFAMHGSEVAAVITEGIQGVGGIRLASDAFLLTIRRLCDQWGAVFVADSVQCGYGRSGRFFSHDYSGVSADVYSVAKGMGNGFPIGGILIAPHIRPKYGMLGTTFGGNPLACAAALAVLEVIRDEHLMENTLAAGAFLKGILAQFPALEHTRGRGLMIGVDVNDRPTLRKNLLYHHQVFTGKAKPNVIRFLPALNIKETELNLLQEALSAELMAEIVFDSDATG